MGPDLKKISTTTWIILAGIFLYTATLWQRPLFIFEFSSWENLSGAAFNGGYFPLSRHLELFLLKFSEGAPFLYRIFTALLTLLASFVIFQSGLRSSSPNSARTGAMIFLLTPAVFLGGTSASPALQQGALLTAALFSFYALSDSQSRKAALIWGIVAAFAVTALVTLFAGAVLYLTALLTAAVYLFCRYRSGISQSSFKSLIAFFLPFVPGAFFLSGADWSGLFALPGKSELKTLAAFMAAGTFPWIVFAVPLLKNCRSCAQTLVKTPFTLFALTVFVCALPGAIFSTDPLAPATASLAGAAILAGTLMEIEYLENGANLFDKLLWCLAILYFLAAAAIGGYAALTLYTKWLQPAFKLFTAKDAWALTALVPVVSAIWFIAGAGEKLHKERKFLALCAGTAFMLLAFHGLVPLKITENNAPIKFLTQAVRPRLVRSAEIYCDKELFTPAKAVFKERTLKQLPPVEKFGELKAAVKAQKSFCVLTLSRKTSDALPFPKTTLRSGKFTAVFYNIDFPEMRMRKL